MPSATAATIPNCERGTHCANAAVQLPTCPARGCPNPQYRPTWVPKGVVRYDDGSDFMTFDNDMSSHDIRVAITRMAKM